MRRVVAIAAALLCAWLSAACAGRTASPSPSAPVLVGATMYLGTAVTDEQRSGAEAAIRTIPGVRDVAFKSGEQAYEEFKRDFSAAPDLVAATKPGTFPATYRFRLPEAGADEALAPLRTLSGVDFVQLDPTLPSIGPVAVPS